MPTYEYACDGCQHRFETVQSIHADALKTCPKCRADTLRRLISGGLGFFFKNQPRTLGAVADRNAAKLAAKGELPKQVRRRKDYTVPWWRPGDKINYDVLKDPQTYIETGRT